MSIPIPSYATIKKLVKSGLTIEAQEQIMELREAAVERQADVVELKLRISELESEIRDLESLEGDPCPKCSKRSFELISTKPDPTFGDLGGIVRTYTCSECGFSEPKFLGPGQN